MDILPENVYDFMAKHNLAYFELENNIFKVIDKIVYTFDYHRVTKKSNTLCQHETCDSIPFIRSYFCTDHQNSKYKHLVTHSCYLEKNQLQPIRMLQVNKITLIGQDQCPYHMHDLVCQKCIFRGKCVLNAFYNYPTENKPIFCLHHKKDHMVNLFEQNRGKIIINPYSCRIKCVEKYCMHNNHINKIDLLRTNNSKYQYCKIHKTNNIFNNVQGLCRFPGCVKTRSFGYPNTTQRIFCSEHSLIGMVNLSMKKCVIHQCNNIGRHNRKLHTSKYCKQHAKLYIKKN